MRNLTYGGGLLLVGVAAIVLVRTLDADPGVHEAFPAATAGDWERIALYIGINEYPADDIKDLAGCVNDMKRLRAVLRDRYGFKRDALLTNEKATRRAVGDALLDLLDQTKKAVANGVEEPLVVLAYAGHGNLVQDQDDDEKTKRKGPRKDSSWVMYDSDAAGHRDIRDDDIRKIIQAIQAEGATVVLFIDACHSATSFRGSDDARMRSVRAGRGGDPGEGPATSLFPDLPYAKSPRMASFSACQDAQEAWEESRDGVRGGCFTHTLVAVLQRSEALRSYEELGRLLCERFAADWPGGKQQPYVRVSDGMEQRIFFGRDVAPPYARIKRGKDDRHVELLAGTLQGAAVGTRIEFFLNLDDLVKRRGVVARGSVESCDAGTSVVRLNRPGKLDPNVVARLVPSDIPDLRIHVAGELSADAKAVLEPLRASKEALFAGAGEPYAFAVADDPETKSLGIFAPGTWPVEGAKPLPVARIPYEAASLLHFAQLQRLLGFRADESRLRVEFVDGEGKPLPRDPATGLVTVKPNSQVLVRVENRGPDALYLFAWVYEEELAENRRFDAFVLWPQDEDEDGAHEVKAGETYPSSAYYVSSKWGTASQLHVSVLATDRYYDYALMSRLVTKPLPKSAPLKAARGAGHGEDGLLDLLEGVAEGAGAARGMTPRERIWATANAVIDVRD